LKEPSLGVLRLIAQQPGAFVTSAEVLQELLHRFLAINRWAAGRILFTEFSDLMRNRVEPILHNDVEKAAALAEVYPDLDARDLVHVAVMQRVGAGQIVSADRDFDRVTGVERLDPETIDLWQDRLRS
jgi:uncharacterized protein